MNKFIKALKKLNWTPIVEQLLQKGWSFQRIVSGIVKYAIFLALLDIYPNLTLVPSKDIDEVWHCHVLNTQQYEQDTRVLLNCVVDHFPYFGLRGEDDRQERDGAFEETLALFKERFGIDLVSEAADCQPLIEGADCQPLRSVISEHSRVHMEDRIG